VLDRVGEQGLGRFDDRLIDVQKTLRETITMKSDLIDRFKRERSIMRNSLRYLPAAAAELKGKLREAGDAAPQKRGQLDAVASAVDQIVQDANKLESAKDGTEARRLDSAIGRLAVNRADYPSSVWEAFDVFVKHASQIAMQTEREMESLQALAHVPLAAHIDDLEREVRKAFDRVNGERGSYRKGFYAYCGVLVVALFFLAAPLWRRRGQVPAGPSRGPALATMA
jgi:hypothetical protein